MFLPERLQVLLRCVHGRVVYGEGAGGVLRGHRAEQVLAWKNSIY